jgi:transposase InsO family protein
VSDFDAALARCGTLDEDVLARPWPFRGRPMDLRYALYRTLEDAQEVFVRVSAGAHAESRRILALAQHAFGELRGLLAGLPEPLLDKAPRAGEWPIREVLAHMLAVEQRYALQTGYAVDRTDADPMRIPDNRMPPTAPAHVAGEVDVILARLAEARGETNRRLGDVALAAMTRPTMWMGHDVDVRFRLHRFAAHVVEHTIQCEKALVALGWRQTEGRLIARRLAGVVGEIEGLGATTEAGEIESRLAERLATLQP